MWLKKFGVSGLVVLGLSVASVASSFAAPPSQFPQGPSLRETGRIGEMFPQGSGVIPREDLATPTETTVQRVSFVDRNATAASGAGSIDADVLEREVQARLATAQSCRIDVARRKQLPPSEVVTGPLSLRWTILPTGMVVGAAVISTMADDADLADCVKKQMVSWVFTRPSGGEVNVQRTFQLTPAQQR